MPSVQQRLTFLLSVTAILLLVGILSLTTLVSQEEVQLFPLAAEGCEIVNTTSSGHCITQDTAKVSLSVKNNNSSGTCLIYGSWSPQCGSCGDEKCRDRVGNETKVVAPGQTATLTIERTADLGKCIQVDASLGGLKVDPDVGALSCRPEEITPTPTPTSTPTSTPTPTEPPPTPSLTPTPTLVCPIPQAPILSANSTCWDGTDTLPTITLSWNDVEDEEGYRIYRKTGFDQWQLIDTVNKNTTDYQTQGTQPESCPAAIETTWGVSAVSSCGSSPIRSDLARTVCCFATPTPTPTPTPAPLACKSSCNPQNDLCSEGLTCQEYPTGSAEYYCLNPLCPPTLQEGCECVSPSPTPTPFCPDISGLDFHLHCVRDGQDQSLRNIEFHWKNFARFWAENLQQAAQIVLELKTNVHPQTLIDRHTTTMFNLIKQGTGGSQSGCGASSCWYQFEKLEMGSYRGKISATLTNACSALEEEAAVVEVSGAGCGDPSKSISYEEKADLAQKDINQDGQIGPADASLLVRCWASRSGEPKYNPQADINKDSICNALDASILVSYWGMTY